MKVADVSGDELDAWVSKALGESKGTPYTLSWPGFDQVIEREAIHIAPLVGRGSMWCAIVVGRPGGRLPEGKGGWMEGAGPRMAVARAILSARYGASLPD